MTRAILLLGVLSAAGCSGQGGEAPGEGGWPAGRFAHSAIQIGVAPWDGEATQLVLSETPFKPGKADGPHVLLQVYKQPAEASDGHFVLDGSDRRLGGALWVGADGSRTTRRHAVVSFGAVKVGEPVAGTYEVELPDGSRARGSFRAGWWPRAGIGG